MLKKVYHVSNYPRYPTFKLIYIVNHFGLFQKLAFAQKMRPVIMVRLNGKYYFLFLIYMTQCACWDLRFSQTEEVNHRYLIDRFSKIAKKWVFQLEKGEETGYIHYQCRISLTKKTTKQPLLTMFEHPPQYAKPTTKENYKNDNVFYVVKEQTRIDGPWKSTDAKPKFIPIQFRHIKELYPYQDKIIKNYNFNFRNCNIIIDLLGNIGKSVLAFMCYLHLNALYIPPMNDAQKIIEYISSVLEHVEDDQTPTMMLFDLPRSMSKDCLFGMYSAIEQLKTGFLYDTRYKGRGRWINSPNIWVFTNEAPDTARLTADRWSLWEVDEDKELIKYKPPKSAVKVVKRLV